MRRVAFALVLGVDSMPAVLRYTVTLVDRVENLIILTSRISKVWCQYALEQVCGKWRLEEVQSRI